jgi:chaperonin GroEL
MILGKYKTINLHEDARSKIIEGINRVANTVKITLGAKGRNVAIRSPFAPPRITKDGVSIAKQLQFRDEGVDMGAALISNASAYTVSEVGDGTTTTCVLTQAIVNEGNKFVVAGFNPIYVKRGIDLAVDKVVEYLDGIKKTITSDEELKNVARVSANGDSEMADKIVDALNAMGETGSVLIEESKQSCTPFTLEIISGMQFKIGYSHPYFITDPNKMKCEYEDCLVLVIDEEIANLGDVKPFLQNIANNDVPLIIFCRKMHTHILEQVVQSKIRHGFKIAVVEVQQNVDVQDPENLFEDIAARTGTEVFSPKNRIQFLNFDINRLGKANKIIIGKDTTRILSNNYKEEVLNNRIAYYKAALEQIEYVTEKDTILLNLARLQSGIAVLKPGGATEVEMKERKDRLEDAYFAAVQARKDGILPGGGIAQLLASKFLKNIHDENKDIECGIRIVQEALTSPIKQICKNGGISGDQVIGNIAHNAGEDIYYGFNVANETYGNLLDLGIIDAANVTKRSLRDAASIAGLVLTTEAIIYDDLSEKGNEQDKRDAAELKKFTA